ncbi:hypothetical protein KJ980_06480 [Patescibacteria group bacterium]|nr:hypothetical protein [Patescibacteria group bacterium]MBU4016601.1 hypothetical protein [Patescibacteria group bacterium]MBU4099265.1 hypothetical protein [Patescibacteria group bacterium]
MTQLQRFSGNPILSPDINNSWEHDAAFNGCVVRQDNVFHMVYRALSAEQKHEGISMKVSSIGYAQSQDGTHFGQHQLLFSPTEDWEIFGCEDPRITYLNGKYYIFYTALSVFPFTAYGIKLGVAITQDFKAFEKHPVTTFNSKAMGLFPDKVQGKMAALLTVHTDLHPAKIALAVFDKEEDIWSPYFWEEWYDNLNSNIIHLLRDLRDQVELGAPPIKTKEGWLVIYSYIKNYLSNNKDFGIEAVLLDEKDPRKILGRTQYSLLTPQEDYELKGEVSNIVFPSGAWLTDDTLSVYYGAADTRICVASCSLSELLKSMIPEKKSFNINYNEYDGKLVRFEGNPILTPKLELDWQASGVFNPAAVYADEKVHIVYRAQSRDGTSTFGYASSKDGFHIDENLDYPIYVPREDFEKKPHPLGNSGCEDPRLTRIGNRYFVTYTAYNGVSSPRVALSSISIDDFLNKRWNWDTPKLISLPGVDDKDACIIEGKTKNTYIMFHRMGDSIWIEITDNLDFGEKNYLAGSVLVYPRGGKWDNVKLGIAGPPFETKEGWVLLYHGVSQPGNVYKVGALLLDLYTPTKVLARTDYPIFEPEMPYELEGQVPNVVFPCGQVVIKDLLYVYYGGGDKVVGVATVPLENLLKKLLSNPKSCDLK